MSMPRFRPPAAAVAALLLGAWVSPLRSPDPLPQLTRFRAVRDSGFALPDSVRGLLSRVTALAVAPDGGLYVADPSLGAVLRLTPSGDFHSVVGRRGAGPGEFNTVLLLGFHRDSLWVLDPALVRLTLLPRSGAAPLTVPLGMSAASAAGRPQARRGMPSSILPDGTLLVEEPARASENGTSGEWAYRYLFHTDRNLEILDTVARHSLAHSSMVFSYREGESHLAQPFSDDPMYAVQPDGSTVVLVERGAPDRGLAGTITVRIWRGHDQPLITRQIPYTGARLRQSLVDSAVGQYFVQGDHRRIPGTQVTVDSVRDRLYRPAIFPPVEDVRIARDGAIWLRVHLADSPEGMGDWLVLSGRGFEMYRVSLPASFRILEANRRTLWGIEGDALDVPLLVRYTVVERPV